MGLTTAGNHRMQRSGGGAVLEVVAQLSPPADAYRSPTDMNERNRNVKAWWWSISAVLICVLFFRGNHLLGASTGITFAFISLAIATIGYRNLVAQAPSRTGMMVYSLFAISCLAVMLAPSSFSPTLQHFIDKQAADRTARSEIAALVRDNAEYRDLKIETKQLKVVFVSIKGKVQDRDTVDRLIADLSQLDFTRHCSLRGQITIQGTGEVRKLTNDDLARDTEETAGNHAVHRSGVSAFPDG